MIVPSLRDQWVKGNLVPQCDNQAPVPEKTDDSNENAGDTQQQRENPHPREPPESTMWRRRGVSWATEKYNPQSMGLLSDT